MWRDIAINRAALWPIVPLSDQVKIPWDYKSILELVLHRNKGVGLNLIANTRYVKSDIFLLVNHVTQFHTVNIVDTSPPIIRTILAAFTDRHGPEPLRLSQLSLYKEYPHPDIPQAENYVFGTVSEQQPFNQLVKNLTLLQMKSTLLYWETIVFSGTDRLTTFYLEDVVLGFDTELVALLGALSSATQLRELRIISVSTYRDLTPLQALVERSKAWLPTLETLFIGDLYFNSLGPLLSSFQPRSHRLSLELTSKAMQINSRTLSTSQNMNLDKLCDFLKPVPVRALSISICALEQPVLSAVGLKKLVEALSPLETLRLRMVSFDGDYCKALERTREPHESALPSLVSLYFSPVTISDLEAFKRMVKSHSGSIRQVVLARTCLDARSGSPDGEWRRKIGEMMNWLKRNVPEFVTNLDTPEFWRIWCQV